MKKRPNRPPAPLLALLLATTLVLPALFTPAQAYENESLEHPIDGAIVGSIFDFYIEADGEPAIEEFYRIEVALDDEFEKVVKTYDSNKKGTGWRNIRRLDGVPSRYQTRFDNGVLLKVRSGLDDGEYFWRASKAIGAGAWQPIGDVEEFVLDSRPPAPIQQLELQRDAAGNLVFNWEVPGFNADGGYESVAGFRLYRYTRTLKRYPVLTKYLIAETESAGLAIPTGDDEDKRIIFYRVQAVDDVGNEAGRPSPRQIGSLDEAFNPPDLDQLTNLEYLKRLHAEAAAEEDR